MIHQFQLLLKDLQTLTRIQVVDFEPAKAAKQRYLSY
jgi:hypothetical protein